MSGATDIRAWAAENGIELGSRGRIPADVQARFDAEHPPPAAEEIPMPEVPVNGEVPPSPPPTGETAPLPPPPRGRFAGFRKPRQPRPPRDHKPGKTAKRVPLETWAARVWKGLAYIAGAGATPTSRVLNMQAPVAGVIVDDLIKGTLPDRLLQPLARWGEQGKDAAALVGLPVLVAVTERAPQLYPYTRPLMAEAATEWVLIAGPAMRKAKQRAAQVAKELEEFELDEDAIEGMFEHPASNPVIEKMLDVIFAPMFTAPAEPQAAPETAEAAA